MKSPLATLVKGKTAVTLIAISAIIIGLFLGNTYLDNRINSLSANGNDPALHARFVYLSSHGNSSCSGDFYNSISTISDDTRLQGSCCSPMTEGRYIEQVTNLKKYKDVSVIPSDPYDIPAKLAKQLLNYNNTITPTVDEQKILDAAVAASPEKGYCCCKCWRWYVYEGLSKYLVHEKHFTAQQITDVLTNSDGCGGTG